MQDSREAPRKDWDAATDDRRPRTSLNLFACGDLLLHVDNGHHPHFNLIKFINDPIPSFVDFAKLRTGEFVDRVPRDGIGAVISTRAISRSICRLA